MNVGSLDFANLPGWLQLVTALTAILAAAVGVIAFVRKTWPVVVSFVKTVISLQTLPEFMEKTSATLARQDKQLADIHHEVQFNNGSSVKDAITRVEATTTRLEEGVAGLYTRMNAADEADKRLRADLDEATQPVVRHGQRRRQPPKKENP